MSVFAIRTPHWAADHRHEVHDNRRRYDEAAADW
jgi:hypothetical protein